MNNNNVIQHKRISRMGRALRQGSDKDIVDLDKLAKIDFSFQLNLINDLVNEFKGVMPPNRTSHYVVAFIRQGAGKKTIGNYTFEIKSDMALFIPRYTIHSTDNWSLDTKGYMLTFSDQLFESYSFPKSFLQLQKLFLVSSVPYAVFSTDISKKVLSIFKELNQLYTSDNVIDRNLFVVKLSELILIYQKEFTNSDSYRVETTFDQFNALLEAYFKTEKVVAFYALKLGVHPNYLNRLVRSCSQFSVKEYINQRVVLEAKYLLSSTLVPVKKVAVELGYPDVNYFSRFFKKHTGCSPKQYRLQHV